MKFLCFFIGIRGAGKTTLLSQLSTDSKYSILKPSTTRPMRGEYDSEYHFVSEWDESQYCWTIEINGYRYGLSRKEIENVCDSKIGLTVFDPSSIAVLDNFRSKSSVKTFTVGLNTIHSIEEQHLRVSQDISRIVTKDKFINELEVVLPK